MTLSVFERLQLLELLQGAEGDVVTLRIVRELQTAVGFSEAETKAVNLRREGEAALWDVDADPGKDVEIGARARAIIANQLKARSAKACLRIDQLALYERFVPDEAAAGAAQ